MEALKMVHSYVAYMLLSVASPHPGRKLTSTSVWLYAVVLGPDKATETQEVSLGARMNRFSDLGKNRDLTKAVQLT